MLQKYCKQSIFHEINNWFAIIVGVKVLEYPLEFINPPPPSPPFRHPTKLHRGRVIGQSQWGQFYGLSVMWCDLVDDGK